LINHGERADYAEGFKYPLQDEFDPPITPKGMQQSALTGKFLNTYFKLK
jgi:hypothetical protein